MIFQKLYDIEPDAVTDKMLNIVAELSRKMCTAEVICAPRLKLNVTL